MEHSIFQAATKLCCASRRAIKWVFFLSLLTITSIAQSAPTRISSGLIGEYKFDAWNPWFPDQTGNSAMANWHAYASVGDDAESTIGVKGWSSRGLFLNGSEWLTVKASFGTSPLTSPFNFGKGNFTISAWVKPWNVSGFRTIVDNRGTNGRGFIFYIYNGSLRLKLIDKNGTNTYYTSAVIDSDNRWRHITVVAFRKERVAYFLVDGKQVKAVSLPVAESIDNNTLEWLIGKKGDSSSSNFHGRIDHLYIYNRGLQINEIQTFITPGIPSYDPGYWNNNSTTQNNNNCYNYAMNIKRNSFAQPGEAGGFDSGFELGCDVIHTGLIADGLVPISSPSQAAQGKGVIATATDVYGFYHVYRRDANGYWSHKDGKSPATNRDASNKLITDPKTANRGDYTVFCGYYSIWTDSIQGQGHEIISN